MPIYFSDLTNEPRITDKQRLDWLESGGGMPSYSRHSGKWEYCPWSDSQNLKLSEKQ